MTADCTGACAIVLEKVFPSMGFITATLIALSPLSAVREVMAKEDIESTNTFPFSMMIINSLAWAQYGYYIKDAFVFAPNLINFLTGIYYTFNTLPYQSKNDRFFTTSLVMVGTGVCLLLGSIGFIAISDFDTSKNLLGTLGVVILIIFYGAPLSSISQVIKDKDSSSINLNLAIAALLNGILWTTYGLIISDLFVSGPNAIGTLFAIIQLVLKFTFKTGIRSGGGDVLAPGSPYRTLDDE